MLKARVGPKSESAKARIMLTLEHARLNVEKANERYLRAWKDLEETKMRCEDVMEEKRVSLEEEMKQQQEKFNQKYLERIESKRQSVKAAENIIEARKARLKQLEILYLEQLEAGHWINDETEGVDGEEKESEAQSV